MSTIRIYYKSYTGRTVNCNVLVDEEDFERISKLTLRIRFRAPEYTRIAGVFVVTKPLTEIILGKKAGFVIDHIDRDPLNNTKINLRYLTKGHNGINKSLSSNNTSGYVGVYNLGPRNYCAEYSIAGVDYRKWKFTTAKEAAEYYDSLVEKHCPLEIKRTNKSLGLLHV